MELICSIAVGLKMIFSQPEIPGTSKTLLFDGAPVVLRGLFVLVALIIL